MSNRYSELRRREGWADASGGEHPHQGSPWRRRVRVARRALAELRDCRLVLDAGAGGGWLAELLPGVRVIALDLRPPAGGSLALRGDLNQLPLAADSVDAVVYAASLHHARLAAALAEAARVTRAGGRLVVFDSPVYGDVEARARAVERSRAYFRRMDVPELAESYHPILEAELRACLKASGYDQVRLRRGWRHRHLAVISARREE